MYNIGDKIRIKRCLYQDFYNGLFVSERMRDYEFKRATIIKIVYQPSHGILYRLDCDNGTWLWNKEMFDPTYFHPIVSIF